MTTRSLLRICVMLLSLRKLRPTNVERRSFWDQTLAKQEKASERVSPLATLPSKSAFDAVCRLCAKKGNTTGDSSDSATPSSTSDHQQ